MENDLIRRSDVIRALGENAAKQTREAYDNYGHGRANGIVAARDLVRNFPAVGAVEVPETGIGDLSDGYHTFNDLYHQRAVLFAALVKAYKDRAWKSWRHSDGELPFGKEDYFIVGIDTPEGSYTYHYHGEYWDVFDCVELPRGKEWDGHTDKDVTRLLSLPVDAVEVVHGEWIEDGCMTVCSVCHERKEFPHWICCPACGARMDGGREEEHNAAD